jgi:NitT/TauT family transport system substrate-binding protein
MSLKLRLLSALVCAISTNLLIGAGFSRAEEMKIGVYPGAVISIPAWIAQAKGFYKDAGIDAELIAVTNGPMMTSNLASGVVDVGVNSPSHVGLAKERGLDLSIVMGDLMMPIVLIGRTDLNLPDVKYPEIMSHLKGLKWGSYGRGTDLENIMRFMAEQGGLDPDKDVTWIGVGGPATGLPALKSAQIDVYGTIMPAPELAEAGGYGKSIIDMRKGEGPGDLSKSVSHTYMARADRIKEKEQLFRNFIKANEKSYCWLKDPSNFDEAASIIEQQLGIAGFSDEDFRKFVHSSIALVTVKYPAAELDVWSDMFIKAGVLKQPMTASSVWVEAPVSDPVCN